MQASRSAAHWIQVRLGGTVLAAEALLLAADKGEITCLSDGEISMSGLIEVLFSPIKHFRALALGRARSVRLVVLILLAVTAWNGVRQAQRGEPASFEMPNPGVEIIASGRFWGFERHSGRSATCFDGRCQRRAFGRRGV
ncbi:MAG: hypothetical protein IPK19_37340 [Chloroflexi bacterium]|nr:hypothetical protein [Chloroflexota bacterium]